MMKKRQLKVLLLTAIIVLAAAPGAAAAQIGITSASGALRGPGGEPLHAAGAHADFTTSIKFKQVLDPETGLEMPAADPHDVDIVLPPGLVGNPLATPKCSQAAMSRLKWFADCEPEAQVGTATIVTYNAGFGFPLTVPVYNVMPPKGVAGQFAFNVLSTVIFINATVTATDGYRLRVDVSKASQGLALGDTSVTLWGLPASTAHDFERVKRGGFSPEGEAIKSAAPLLPMMSNPTSCTGAPLRTEIAVDSWQEPGVFATAAFETEEDGTPLTIVECDEVPFEGSLQVQPTSRQAGAPTGLDVALRVPQNQLPDGLSASHLRDAVVELPAGMAVNPSAANGLGACSPAQIGIGDDAAPSCPDSAKIGSVRVDTPLLDEPLTGAVYLAQQRQNQFGSLLALYIVVDDPTTGVRIKIPGKVDLDAADGRLVTRFEQTPQLPFEAMTMHLDGGPRAPLVNPPACGTYETRGTLTPWSGAAPVPVGDSFTLASGPGGGACPAGRFEPRLEAGSADPSAGRYSPFELRISRDDASEALSSVAVGMPRGFLARLAGIPYCSDAALAAIPSTEGTGAAQLASPSCPAASRVGSVAVATGAGSNPFWVKTGTAYLAGPYKGAPLSLAIVTPALAGPFDLGNVVVRTALEVDPVTAQVTAKSDPLPTILQGIPLGLQTVQVVLDRPDFTLNPTSCRLQRVTSTIVSVGGRAAQPSEPFAAASCDGLGFSPKLQLSLKGGTHRRAFPALTAKLKTKPGQANIRRVSVQLPPSVFLAQEHIGTVCTRVQFAASECPKASIYGYAEARTPLLDKPLKGPVYLRSSSNTLPDLVAALRGQIEIDLQGRIDSKNGGIRTTFESLPDAPISSFVLRMRGGKKSLLVNSTNLCRGKHRAQIKMLAQNGKRTDSTPALSTACGKRAK